MKKRSLLKPILYTLGAIVATALVAIWIFLTFYFEDALNKYAIPRITDAARVATHGKYRLTMGRISYSDGSFFCKNFILSRAGYDSSEHGNALKRVSIDSVRFIGMSWWDALWGNDMRMKSLELSAPKIYFTDVEKELGLAKNLPLDTSIRSFSAPKHLQIISFDSILLRNVSVYLPDRSQPGDKPSLSDIEFKLTNFSLDSKTLVAQPLLFSERVDFSMRGFDYNLPGGDYTLGIQNLRGSFSDSLLVIDTFVYKPLYSKEEFAARHRYVQPRLDFRCFKIRVSGINFVKLIADRNLTFRSCAAASWSLDFYCDKRPPNNPHPPDAVLPNDLVRSIHIPIDVDSVILDHGYIHWGERWPGSIEPGTLTFNQTRIAAFPFCTDTLSTRFSAPTHISFDALFLDESPVHGIVMYQLHNKALNCNIDATVGTLHAVKLNSELIPNERIQVTEGTATHGVVRMNIKNGFATTTVTPEYHDLSVRVLANDPSAGRGILEGIKTFIANTFTIRKNNMSADGKQAASATTTMTRSRDWEYLQFVWLSLRQSLGKVIGFSSPKP